MVRFLAEEKGIRQFLDIGSGLPTASNVHEVAQSYAPESRVVYADNDVTVLAHARALLVSAPEGQCGYIHADLRDTGSIITQAAEILDFNKPVAVLLIAILHFVPDQDDPRGTTPAPLVVPSLTGVLLSERCVISGHSGHAARLRSSMVASS